MKILITGKTGYVGNHTMKYLEENTDYAIDIISLRGEEWLNLDFSKYDVVFHSAGVIPGGDIKNDAFFSINRDLTQQLATKAKCEGVKQFIYLSSMAVYGVKQSVRSGEGIIFKNTSCNPNSIYGQSKYEGEKAISSLEDDNFKVAIIRAPSIYGLGNINYFSQYYYLINKLPIQPYAFIRCKRSAIYIDNLSELILQIITNSFRGIICPADRPAMSTIEYVKLLQTKKQRKFMYSRILGLVLELLGSKISVVNNIWGSIAYDDSLTNIFDGKYQIVDSIESVGRAL